MTVHPVMLAIARSMPKTRSPRRFARVSEMPWKVKQYCYFWMGSDTVPAAEIADENDAHGLSPIRRCMVKR